MGLVQGRALIKECVDRGLVAGAFNTTNLETTLGIVAAIERTRIPTFIQVAPTNVTISGYEYIEDMVRRRAESTSVPIALHLDHGRTLDDVAAALRAHFTSIMLDGSSHDYDDNVRLSVAARAMCPDGVTLEAELGSIGGKEDDVAPESAARTDPDQAADFVHATDCDLLAVSVGNVHGHAPDARIDFTLLRRIQRRCPVPLVIHGASGLPDEQLSALRDYGVVKVNVASDLRNAMIRTFGEAYRRNPNENSLIKVSSAAVRVIADTVTQKIRLLNPEVAS